MLDSSKQPKQPLSIMIKYFKPSQNDKANEEYKRIESKYTNSSINAVLVRVDSFKSLKAAYANYFTDIGDFVKTVKEYLTKQIQQSTQRRSP